MIAMISENQFVKLCLIAERSSNRKTLNGIGEWRSVRAFRDFIVVIGDEGIALVGGCED